MTAGDLFIRDAYDHVAKDRVMFETNFFLSFESIVTRSPHWSSKNLNWFIFIKLICMHIWWVKPSSSKKEYAQYKGNGFWEDRFERLTDVHHMPPNGNVNKS